ncbi:MAG TPA: 4-hydroxy-tetrahydrodipicolinate synthase [Abditibacteriaceae bacterium]|jgi:4-hydroxy-tetrahydrodipicolinate synthase
METHTQFGPLVTAMATPFTSSGEVDYGRAGELAAHLVENGTTALVVAGTTGESPTLSHDEKLQLFREVKQATTVPVIAGTTGFDTRASVELSREAAECGVDGLLLVVPYYNKPSQEGLYQHFKAIAAATPLPCLLYNIPGRSARNMEVATTARLSEIPNIIGTKEASGDLAQIGRTRAATPDEFLIYSGNDGDTLPMLTLGACGVISVISHIAGKPMRAMMDAFWKGDMAEARRIHLQLLPVVDALFPATGASPGPLKWGMKRQGFDAGGLRLPLVEASEVEAKALETAMQNAGLI